MFYIGNKILVDLFVLCLIRKFNLISVLYILKYYFYLDICRVLWGGVRVFCSFYEIF